ncbi:YopX family protein [Streptococcus oralis]|uniref:YopX family protein n=1 Tax=Streptococcus oralis TaxID=1303 RepID=UPI0025535AAE|nr:YopX family protein [Streptococcus oralis]MDK7308183.1 YopX family protein [Streptococcus oralis]MDK7311509.1 YopX family protein [Streptococcus oralis]MDK7311567.1 YopX family protein [Streptococcus oralis]
MIPRYRMWNRITSQLHLVDGLYFDDKEAEYVDDDNVLRFVSFKNVELMQSTGLVDKNGKEIFEGDILACKTDDEVINLNIFWDEEHALFMFESKKYNEQEPLAELVENNTYPFEIIGNIYENPELLEDK